MKSSKNTPWEYCFFELFEKFIQASKTGRRLQPNGKRISEGTIRNYQGTLRLVRLFACECQNDIVESSLISKAICYCLKRWDRLSRYCEDGMLNIDNNPVERSIRPVKLGAKNYLFCGSHEAAKRSAMLYSLLGTCKLHGHNPLKYLTEILKRLPSHPINRIKELLPQNWSMVTLDKK